jgi:hypothetical protein
LIGGLQNFLVRLKTPMAFFEEELIPMQAMWKREEASIPA